MEIPAELVVAYAAVREAVPHVIRWAPKLRDFVAGRSQAASAAVVSDAQAMHVRAQADATSSAAWAAFAAELKADRERERQEHAKERERERLEHEQARERERREMTSRLARVEAAEADCQERADRIEAEAKARNDALRTELLEAVRRVQGRATPSTGYPTLVLAGEPSDSRMDPSATVTPPAGHRLIPPMLPVREDDPDPTPDLPSSLTPSRAKTDPPA